MCVLVLSLTGLPAAEASTVTRTAGQDTDDSCRYDPAACRYEQVTVTGSPGEANRISVEVQAREVVVRDEGATVAAGEGCLSTGLNEARCFYTQRLRTVVEAGDGHDVVASGGTLRGGAGDDRLIVNVEYFGNVLDGGGGRDTLIGGPGGHDELDDGDDPNAPDADAVDGGGGSGDRLRSYESRTGDVAVDLNDPSFPAGERGESDAVKGISFVIAGKGDDVLLGTPGSDQLYGSAGDDRILGRGGRDQIGGNAGSDRLYGGEGRDELTGSSGPDILVGGRGGDQLFGDSGADRLFARDGTRDLVVGGRGYDVARTDRRDRIFEVQASR